MANVVREWIYQINQRPPIALASVTSMAFPTTGSILGDCFDSPTRALSSGANVYSFIVDTKGNKYYTTKTIAQLITDFNA
jgi:hypothetical protein